MQYLKKYFTEGLIQMAILLSLCGVMVDVGLEPYLPASWHQRILGPTSALTQTQFHNLRNRLDHGHGLHPKNVDLDSFFTARRLLGFVHSLDRLQVPQAELETWLVQREQDPLPVGLPAQASRLAREPPGVERVQLAASLESRASTVTLHEEANDEEDKEEETFDVHHQSGALAHGGEEDTVYQHYSITEGEGGPGPSESVNNRELTQNEQASSSFQECLRLLEETFPFSEEQQLHDAGGGRGELEPQSPGSQPSIRLNTNPFLDLELRWQDLLAIMEPQHNSDSGTTSFDEVQNSRGPEMFEPLHQSHGSDGAEADLVMENQPQQGSSGPPEQSKLQPALLPLTPVEELDDHSSAFSSGDSGVGLVQSPPDHRDLFAEDPSQDFCLGLSAEDDMNLLAHDLVDPLESSPNPGNTPHPSDLTAVQEGNAVTQDLLASPSGGFLFDEDGIEGDDDLPSPLNDLLEDATILDEIGLLDLALEEGFSPGMAAQLDEAGYLLHDVAQQDPGRDLTQSQSKLSEDQVQPGDYQLDTEHEADSDSGLSLDFSHSQASPCASEASSYSSSSSTPSSDSADESPFSEDEDSPEPCDGAHMEMEVTIKQEEEELGAVGGAYPDHTAHPFHQDEKLFGSFLWRERVGHDHTYNQPWSSSSCPSLQLGKMPTKQSSSSVRRRGARPYHHPSSHGHNNKMWSHDERRARASKVPFSNELIVNLPVEEFNDLLRSFQLNEEQLALIRDIRRRGKNKVAAQNCRKRKMDALLGLNDEVSGLMRRRSRLLREKQEATRNLQEMKRRLSRLYEEVFSRLRDEEGRPLDPAERELRFGPEGGVTVVSSGAGGTAPLPRGNGKQRDKKK